MSCENGIVRVIPPITIDDSVLNSTNVLEDEYLAYSSATTYEVGDFAIESHKIYECQAASTLDKQPSLNPAIWTDRGATNAYRMFDQKANSLTANDTTITVVLEPSERYDSLALLQVSAAYVDVDVSVSGSSIYSETFTMQDLSAITDFYQYLFVGSQEKSTLIITDLPTHSSAITTVTIRRDSGEVSCGVLVVGKQIAVGDLTYGWQVGIKSNSKKEIADDGSITVKKGKSSKTGDFPVIVNPNNIDYLLSNLEPLDSIPAVYIAGKQYDSQSIYGFYERLEMVIPDPVNAEYNLEVQGII